MEFLEYVQYLSYHSENCTTIKLWRTIRQSMGSVSRYTASMPAAPFTFPESKLIAGLMLELNDRASIKKIVHEGNLLQVKTTSNEDKIFDYVYSRLDMIPDGLKEIIVRGEESDGRYVNLISIMKRDMLFKEFIEDVYFERLTDKNPITDYDIMSFFERKGREDPTVASWKYITVFKLRRLYTRILFEAGFLKTSTGSREVCTPYIGRSTIDALLNEGYGTYIRATLGYR